LSANGGDKNKTKNKPENKAQSEVYKRNTTKSTNDKPRTCPPIRTSPTARPKKPIHRNNPQPKNRKKNLQNTKAKPPRKKPCFPRLNCCFQRSLSVFSVNNFFRFSVIFRVNLQADKTVFLCKIYRYIIRIL
jgi:hypothetical protein